METIQAINERLVRDYGKLDDLMPFWRVSWSEDQFEKRLSSYTDEGFELLFPEVRLLPKYKQWIQNKYILERLTVVPEIQQHEIPSDKITYEPVWVFENNKGEALPPNWSAIQLIIKSVHDAQGYKGTKYKDPYSDPKTVLDVKKKEVEDLETALFGNETVLADALAYREGVGYTGPTALPTIESAKEES